MWPLVLRCCFHHAGWLRESAKPWQRGRERGEGQSSFDSRSCSLHAPNPLLSSTCHTLAAKWNWLLISPLPPSMLTTGQLCWQDIVGSQRALCRTTRGEERNMRKKKTTHYNTHKHRHTFLLTTVFFRAYVKEEKEVCATTWVMTHTQNMAEL